MTRAFRKRVLAVAMLSSIAFTAFADDAPVYEVDNYPPAFDGQPYNSEGYDAGASAPTPAPAAVPTYTPPPPPKQSLSPQQRLSRLEQQLNNLQQSNTKTEELQKEVQSLRGQVEVLTHQLQQAQTQQQAMYSDLDKRLANLPKQAAVTATQAENPTPIAKPISKPKEVAAAKTTAKTSKQNVNNSTVAAPAKVSNMDQPNVLEEQQIYQTAYDLIKSKKYNEAILALQKMLQKYPSGQFAANAHYWLGELYGLLNKNDQSALEFSMVVKMYPESPKVSDAQLKLGLIYAGQFKWTDAKAAFKKVINQYPGTASARLASEQLKQIKQAGH